MLEALPFDQREHRRDGMDFILADGFFDHRS